MKAGLDKFGQGCGSYLATGTYFQPELYENPTIDGRNDALIFRSGVYNDKKFYDFDHLNVREDIGHSLYAGASSLHPWEGRTEPIDPLEGHKQGGRSSTDAPVRARMRITIRSSSMP